MKKKVASILLIFLLLTPTYARADFFGGDLPLLAQILQQAIQQLYELNQIFKTGQDSFRFIQDINQGVNDSMELIRTAYPNIDPGIFRKWNKIQLAIRGVKDIYGNVPNSPESTVQTDTDQSVAEAITLNNSIYKYTGDIDQIGEEIKEESHKVSPGGAQKLTAESIGIMLNVLNETLRTQATGLKLQAQELAVQNHKEKESTKYLLNTSDELGSAMATEDTSYGLPRF